MAMCTAQAGIIIRPRHCDFDRLALASVGADQYHIAEQVGVDDT
jgi:hypothetical protein